MVGLEASAGELAAEAGATIYGTDIRVHEAMRDFREFFTTFKKPSVFLTSSVTGAPLLRSGAAGGGLSAGEEAERAEEEEEAMDAATRRTIEAMDDRPHYTSLLDQIFEGEDMNVNIDCKELSEWKSLLDPEAGKRLYQVGGGRRRSRSQRQRVIN